jgi:uncharacterized protein YndB with AHSA1/START domain
MSRVTVRLDQRISAPAERAFDQATDLEAFNDWMPVNGVFKHIEHVSPGPVGPGTTYVDRGRMGSFKGEVIEYELPAHVKYHEKLRWLGLPVTDAWMTYDFERAPGGTIVHHVAESEFHGMFRLFGPSLARRIAPGERRRTLDALQRSVESASAGSEAEPEQASGDAPACAWHPPEATEEVRRAA